MKLLYGLMACLLCSAVSAQDLTVTGFDGETHTGGSTLTKIVDFPSDISGYETIIMNISLTCPPGGCDPWDRFAQLSVVTDAGETIEIGRYATPYGNGDCGWTLDVSDYRKYLQGSTELVSHIETYQNGWNIHTSFDYYAGTPTYSEIEIIEFLRDNQFTYGDTIFYSINLPDFEFLVPDGAEEVVFRVINTGHGQGNTDNAAEFSQKTHAIRVNGVDEFEQFLWKPDCDENPCSPQAGTWQFARAGWCPGQAITPWDYDVTSLTAPGEMLTLDYVLEPFFNECSPANPDCNATSDCSGNSCLYNDNTHTTPVYKVALQVILKGNVPLNVLEEADKDVKLNVFPNPAENVLNLSNDRREKLTLQIIGSTGKVMMTDHMDDLTKQIDLTDLSHGVYLLRAANNQTTWTHRFLIQR